MESKKGNKDEYIVIHKETLVNYFFISVLVIALGLFLTLLVTGIYKMSKNDSDGIDLNLITYHQDDLLNIHYPVPGGDWAFVEFDTTELEKSIEKSSGDDGYFSIEDDALIEEVVSYLGVLETNPESTESGDTVESTGIREFMSFTFMPDVEYQGEEFVSFCQSMFEKSIKDAGDIDQYNLYYTNENMGGGILMRMLVHQAVDDGSLEETYYTQYIKRVGKNIGIITYGSLMEDETVDPYLVFFLSNIRSEKSTIS